MSAQAGMWNFDGKPADKEFLAKLSDTISQYGPDGENTYLDGAVGMLYRPFHTTAESRREKQPYFSGRAGFILTYDGRLDNRDELIADLRGNLEDEPTDVAIVSAAYDRWETHCFRRIVGDWAISIWKPEQQELIFAIDYMAIRHIFYHLKKDRIWWSTDLAPLVLLSGDKFHIDDDYISGYFARDPDAHLTPYREIHEVPPGQFVRVHNGSARVERYWRFSPKSRIRYKKDAEYEEDFRYVFRQSVRRRLRSDSPILAELSGGLDSSSIVCMADDILAKEGAETPRMDTISNDDRTEPRADDWIYQQEIEEKRGRRGHHIDVSKYGDSAVLEHPEFFPLPSYLGFGRTLGAEREQIVRNGSYRTVLSGIGGDEFMGGNPDPRALLADLIMQFKFVRLAKDLMTWSIIKRRPWVQLLLLSATEFVPTVLARYLIPEAEIAPWIDKCFARRTRLAIRQTDVGEHFGFWLPTRRSHIAGVFVMSNRMAKVRAPQLATGETRYPYLDQSLIEFILSIPAGQLLRPGERRSLMRRSLVGCVPSNILARRTKQLGRRTSISAIEKNWEELQTAISSSLSSSLRYVNHTRFVEALEAGKNGQRVQMIRLLKTVSLEFWLRDLFSRRLIDAAAISPPSPIAEPLRLRA